MAPEEFVEQVERGMRAIRGGEMPNERLVTLVSELVEEGSEAVGTAEQRGDIEAAAEVCKLVRSLLREAAGVADAATSETFAVSSTYWAMRSQHLEGAASLRRSREVPMSETPTERPRVRRERAEQAMSERRSWVGRLARKPPSVDPSIVRVQVGIESRKPRGITAQRNSSFPTANRIEALYEGRSPGGAAPRLSDFTDLLRSGSKASEVELTALRDLEANKMLGHEGRKLQWGSRGDT